MNCAEARALLHAHLDGELDAAHELEVERHLSACRECRAEHENLLALRDAVRARAPRHPAPAHLRARVADLLRPAPDAARRRVGRSTWWWRTLAPVAATAVLTWMVALHYAKPPQPELATDEVLAAHLRALITHRLTDVESSDRHTVKPWFAGKIDFSPPVADLAREGYALIGARLDYLGDHPVAVLVYQHRRHVISLVVWPGKEISDPQAAAVRGYGVVRWSQGGLQFYAASDMAAEDLAKFVALLREAWRTTAGEP